MSIRAGLLRPALPHQNSALKYARDRKQIALFLEMRLGKSLVAIRWIASNYKNRRILIVAPLTVLPSWESELLKEQYPQHDLMYLVGPRDRRMKMCQIEFGSTISPDTRFYLINYEGLRACSKILEYPWDVIICDECFDGNTKIKTSRGWKKIKNITSNDYVLNCRGWSKVLSTRIKKLDTWIKIKYNGHWIKCSLNHPFLTEHGWVAAKNLHKGDKLVSTKYSKEILSGMPQKISSGSYRNSYKRSKILETLSQETILREILFSEMENATTRNKKQSLQPLGVTKNFSRTFSLSTVVAKISSNSKGKTRQQNARSESSCKSIGYSPKNKMEANSSRRQWQTSPNSTKQIDKIIGKNVANRISDSNPQTFPVPNKLQGGFGLPVEKNSHRSGRIFPHGYYQKKSGSKKRKIIKFFRVEDIKVQKSRNYERPGKSSQKNIFYDLEIENHPSFSVNGVLVHNSARLKNPKAQTTKLLTRKSLHIPYRAILSGLPAPQSPMDYFSQFCFLTGSFMGQRNFWYFRSRFFYQPVWSPYEWLPKKGALDAIKAAVHANAFCLTRQQAKMGSKKIYERRYIQLPPELKKTYRQIDKEFAYELNEKNKKKRIETNWPPFQFLWLSRVAGGFLPDESYAAPHKLEELLELLQGELLNEKVVVWFRFNAELFQVAKTLEMLKIPASVITGLTKPKERVNQSNQFKDKNRIMLCQLKCGKYGIDWSVASTAIYFSNSYDLEDRAQSEDRILHPTKKEPLLYIDLVTQRTVDEDVLEALSDKSVTSKVFMSRIIENWMKRKELEKQRGNL